MLIMNIKRRSISLDQIWVFQHCLSLSRESDNPVAGQSTKLDVTKCQCVGEGLEDSWGVSFLQAMLGGCRTWVLMP